MRRITFLLRAGLGVLVVLTGLGWMVLNHETRRATGAELILQTYPVDPRDILFGHYAILNYRDFGDRDVSVPWSDPRGFEADDTVYVTLRPAGVFHVPGDVFPTLQAATANGDPVLKARLVEAYAPQGDNPDVFHLYFDLPDQYFADPETAIALQTEFQASNTLQRARDRWESCSQIQQDTTDISDPNGLCEGFDPLREPTRTISQHGVILSISQAGDGVIKGLYLDGERVYDTLGGPRLVLDRPE